MLDPKITNSFGGEGGIDEFREPWKLNEPGTLVWKPLEQVLVLGGSFIRSGHFCAPYVFSRFPEGLDPFAHDVIVKNAAMVRAFPSADSSVVDVLSYHVVKTDRYQGSKQGPQRRVPGWVEVSTPSGKTGFVAEGDIRSPTDYRACFVKKSGTWLMDVFVTGD